MLLSQEFDFHKGQKGKTSSLGQFSHFHWHFTEASVMRLLHRQGWRLQAKNQVLIMPVEHSSKRFPYMLDFLPTWLLNHLNNWISCNMISATFFLSLLTVLAVPLILEMQGVFLCVLGLACFVFKFVKHMSMLYANLLGCETIFLCQYWMDAVHILYNSAKMLCGLRNSLEELKILKCFENLNCITSVFFLENMSLKATTICAV